jgi:hypothetical protein
MDVGQLKPPHLAGPQTETGKKQENRVVDLPPGVGPLPITDLC